MDDLSPFPYALMHNLMHVPGVLALLFGLEYLFGGDDYRTILYILVGVFTGSFFGTYFIRKKKTKS